LREIPIHSGLLVAVQAPAVPWSLRSSVSVFRTLPHLAPVSGARAPRTIKRVGWRKYYFFSPPDARAQEEAHNPPIVHSIDAVIQPRNWQLMAGVRLQNGSG
jgi:hypothetical protein